MKGVKVYSSTFRHRKKQLSSCALCNGQPGSGLRPLTHEVANTWEVDYNPLAVSVALFWEVEYNPLAISTVHDALKVPRVWRPKSGQGNVSGGKSVAHPKHRGTGVP